MSSGPIKLHKIFSSYEDNMYCFVISVIPTDGLTLLCARTSVGTMMTVQVSYMPDDGLSLLGMNTPAGTVMTQYGHIYIYIYIYIYMIPARETSISNIELLHWWVCSWVCVSYYTKADLFHGLAYMGSLHAIELLLAIEDKHINVHRHAPVPMIILVTSLLTFILTLC